MFLLGISREGVKENLKKNVFFTNPPEKQNRAKILKNLLFKNNNLHDPKASRERSRLT